MLEEIDVNLDLNEIFNLKKSSICSPGLNPLKKFRNTNITEALYIFNMVNLKQDLSLSNQTF